MLAGHCLSPLGQEWVGKMGFSLSFDKVRTLLEQTNEMLHIEDDRGELPVSYYIDVREPLRKIRVEGLFLDEEELFDLRRSLGTIREDRKSTRLNSSHVKISYAVFCLKKKN